MTLAEATDVEERPKSGPISVLGRQRLRTLVDLAVVAAAALAFRLPAVGFGLPDMLQPDEPRNIRIGSTMAATNDWDPHYFEYSSLMYDVEALAARVQRLFTGHMLGSNSFSSQGFGITRTINPDMVLVLRLIMVALSMGLCLLMYGGIRRITGRRWVAVGCGLLAATSPLLVTNGVFITPDTYSAFFTAATLVGALAIVRRGGRLDYVLAGAAAGFAAGSKYDAVCAVPIVVAYVVKEGRNALRAPALLSLALAAAAAAVAFVLTTPAALFDTSSLVAGLKTELAHYSTGHPGEEGGALGFYLGAVGHDQWVMLPGAILAVVGAWFGRFRKEVTVVAVFALAYFVTISTESVRFSRDLLPLLPALMLLTGFAAAWVAELVAERWPGMPRAGRVGLASAAAVGVLLPSVIGAVGVPETLDEAPRTEALAWLVAHVPKGSSIVNENYGPWISPSQFHLIHVSYVAAVSLPPDPKAIIVTDEGSGRFIDDPKAYPDETATYNALLTRYCVAVKYTNGPWVEVLTPCT